MNTIDIGACVRVGWEAFKKNPWFFVGVLAVILVIRIGFSLLGYIPLLGNIISLILGIFLAMGMTRFWISAHDSLDTTSIELLWTPHPFWKFVGASVLSALIVGAPVIIVAIMWAAVSAASTALTSGVGAVALVVLSILSFIWMVALFPRLMFIKFLVVEKKQGPVTAIKESFRSTRGSWWKLFVLTVFCGLINLLGAVCLLIGLFVTIPVTAIALVHAYRTLYREGATT